jgi:hypothetical protein
MGKNALNGAIQMDNRSMLDPFMPQIWFPFESPGRTHGHTASPRLVHLSVKLHPPLSLVPLSSPPSPVMTPPQLDPELRPPLPSKIRPPPAARVAGTPPGHSPSTATACSSAARARAALVTSSAGRVAGSPAACLLQLGMRARTHLELRRWWRREGRAGCEGGGW